MDNYRKNTSAKVLLPGCLFERILATSDAQFSSCRFQIFNSDPPTGTSYSLKDVLPDFNCEATFHISSLSNQA